MKTRIIQTKFWKDPIVNELTIYSQHLFIYLLTCEHIGLTGMFELPDRYIQFECKLTDFQLEESKKELEEKNRVRFSDGWVKVVNAEKYNNYAVSPQNKIAYMKELDLIPIEVREKLNTTIDTTIITTNDSNEKQETRNKKQEIRNKKPEIKKNIEEIKKEIREKLTM